MSSEIRICPECGRQTPREEMYFTRDCHGITCRLLCYECWKKVMGSGYDGDYYDESSEQIEPD